MRNAHKKNRRNREKDQSSTMKERKQNHQTMKERKQHRQTIKEKDDIESRAIPRPILQREHNLLPGMELSCYEIDEKLGLKLCELEDALETHCCENGQSDSPTTEENQVHHWIDAVIRDDYDAKELSAIIQKITLSPFLRRHLSNPHQIQTPHVLSLSSAMFLVMRVLPPEGDQSNKIRFVSALCVDGLLLTVTNCPTEGKAAHHTRSLNLSARKSIEERELPDPSISGALSMWLLIHVQRVANVAAEIRMETYALEEKMDEDVSSVHLDDLSTMKSKVNRLVAVAEEQLECLESVKEGEAVSVCVDFSKLKGTMGVVMATVGATERMSSRLDKKVTDLRNTYESHQQSRINQRLEVLTVLSAIFLPLSLMAGTFMCMLIAPGVLV